MSSRRVFEPRADDVGAARHFAKAVVESWGVSSDDIEIVVGELAANAQRHAGSCFGVSLDQMSGAVLIEVTDASPQLPRLLSTPPSRTAGRGLVMVDRLARSWGVRNDLEGGKIVWAEIAMSADRLDEV